LYQYSWVELFKVETRVSKKSWVRHLTAEEAASGKFPISSVLLPIPGYDVLLPDNETRSYMDEMLKEDKFSLSMFESDEKDKFVDVPGDYRPVVERARDLTWRREKYKDFTVPLVRTDVEEVFESLGLEKDGGEKINNGGGGGEEEKNRKDGETKDEGDKDAVIVEFTLPPSTYATMALREAMKLSSAVMCSKRN
jgi:tRNA pseudouridine13 synthase